MTLAITTDTSARPRYPPQRPFDDVGLPATGRWTTPESHVTASARQLASLLGAREVADLECWRPAINAACADLAACNGSIVWRYTADTPTVVVLRALGHLACVAPSVRSATAGALINEMTAATYRRPAVRSAARGWTPCVVT